MASLNYKDESGVWRKLGLGNMIHASQHAKDGADPVTPEMIGAATPEYVDEKIAEIPMPKEYSEPVGTIQNTIRTDLDEKWLLCNGDMIDSDNPELFELCLPLTGNLLKLSTSQVEIAAMEQYNGTYVAAGNVPDSDVGVRMFISSDPFSGAWATKGYKPSYLTYVYDVACGDGTWVVLTRYNPSRYNPYIYYADDPFGTWTFSRIEDTNAPLMGIAHGGGTWVAVGYHPSNYYPMIFYTTDLTNQSWPNKTLSTSKKVCLQKVAYFDGTWVAFGQSTGSLYPYVYYTATPGGSWTEKAISYNDSVSGPYAIAYNNGTWLLACRSSNGKYPIIYTATELSGDWTKVLPYGENEGSITSIVYRNGEWMAAGYDSSGYPLVCKATDPVGNWIAERVSDGALKLKGIGFCDEKWFAVGDSANIPMAVSDSWTFLPTISPDVGYTYIKAKED